MFILKGGVTVMLVISPIIAIELGIIIVVLIAIFLELEELEEQERCRPKHRK